MKRAAGPKYEDLLLLERDRTLEDLHRIEEEEAEPQSASAGDTVRGYKTPADFASETLEQEADFMSASRLSERLTHVDDALRLLHEAPERFGLCRSCGRPIDVHRLELVPWSRLCTSCVGLSEEPTVP